MFAIVAFIALAIIAVIVLTAVMHLLFSPLVLLAVLGVLAWVSSARAAAAGNAPASRMGPADNAAAEPQPAAAEHKPAAQHRQPAAEHDEAAGAPGWRGRRHGRVRAVQAGQAAAERGRARRPRHAQEAPVARSRRFAVSSAIDLANGLRRNFPWGEKARSVKFVAPDPGRCTAKYRRHGRVRIFYVLAVHERHGGPEDSGERGEALPATNPGADW